MLKSRSITTLEFNEKQNSIKGKFASNKTIVPTTKLNIAEGKLLQQQIGHTRYRVQRTMTIFFIITWTFLLKIGQICPSKQCASFMCLQYFKSEGNR